MSYKTNNRDRIAWWVCNWILNTFATREYKAFISVLMSKGKKALDEELGIK